MHLNMKSRRSFDKTAESADLMVRILGHREQRDFLAKIPQGP
jgi:hypothetical protein